MNVLVIEDNRRLGEAMVMGLRDAGHLPVLVADGETALREATSGSHEVIILDLMIPGVDGMTVLRRLRRHGDTTPIIIVTARDALEDRVRGLDEGADDYLTKPFAFEELLSRIRAVTRRTHGLASSEIRIADLVIDVDAKRVVRGDDEIVLSAREYQVLEHLAKRRGRVTTRDQLIDALYDAEIAPQSNVVDVFIGHLRKKIDGGHTRKLLHTRRGLGYVLDEGDEPVS